MIVVVINQPLPLLDILKEMPLVESAVANGDKIHVVLKRIG